MKKKNLPKIKKNLKSFLSSEEGKISKKNALKLGLGLTLLATIFGAKNIWAGHSSSTPHSSAFHNSGARGDHGSHSNHSSHNSHGSHGSHGSHDNGGCSADKSADNSIYFSDDLGGHCLSDKSAEKTVALSTNYTDDYTNLNLLA